MQVARAAQRLVDAGQVGADQFLGALTDSRHFHVVNHVDELLVYDLVTAEGIVKEAEESNREDIEVLLVLEAKLLVRFWEVQVGPPFLDPVLQGLVVDLARHCLGLALQEGAPLGHPFLAHQVVTVRLLLIGILRVGYSCVVGPGLPKLVHVIIAELAGRHVASVEGLPAREVLLILHGTDEEILHYGLPYLLLDGGSPIVSTILNRLAALLTRLESELVHVPLYLVIFEVLEVVTYLFYLVLAGATKHLGIVPLQVVP